jgi:hypothetical protein
MNSFAFGVPMNDSFSGDVRASFQEVAREGNSFSSNFSILDVPTTAFESSTFQLASTTPIDKGVLDFTPVPGYDPKPIESQYLKADSKVSYVADSTLQSRGGRDLAEGQSAAIKVTKLPEGLSAEDQAKAARQADIVIGKDGKVRVGADFSDKPLNTYNVLVESGADSAVTEKVIDDLGNLVKGSDGKGVARLDVNPAHRDLVSSDFAERFDAKFRKPIDEPIDQGGSDLGGGGGGGCDGGGGGGGGCDGGGGGGGCDGGGGGGGSDLPETDLNQDQKLDSKLDQVSPNPTNLNNESSAFRALNELSGRVSDMNPVHYSSFLTNILPDNFMEELGPPPWDPKKLAAYLSKHSKEIKDKLGKKGEGLEKNGDKDGAQALKGFSEGLDKALADPAKLDTFAQSMSDFVERSASGKANMTDVHAMFNNDSKLEAAIRNSAVLDAATKYDSSLPGGGADLTRLNSDNAARIVADLQGGLFPSRDGR